MKRFMLRNRTTETEFFAVPSILAKRDRKNSVSLHTLHFPFMLYQQKKPCRVFYMAFLVARISFKIWESYRLARRRVVRRWDLRSLSSTVLVAR